MSWLILVLIATVSDAIRIFTDNYISDVYFKERGAVSQKLFYGWAYIVIGLVIIAVTGFNFATADLSIVAILLLAGAISSLAGIPYYKALEIEDSTNLGIFIQLSPIIYLIFGWLFLNDTFSPIQLVAFLVIIAAPFLIIASTRKRSRKIKLRAVFYAICYVLLSVSGNLIFVMESSGSISLMHALALMFLSGGIVGVTIVYAIPKWRKRFASVYRSSKGKVMTTLAASVTFHAIASACYRLALVAAPAVALASVASDATEPIIIFFMGIILTLIWPKFGREKLNKKTVLVHLVATILVVIGIILLQLPSM